MLPDKWIHQGNNGRLSQCLLNVCRLWWYSISTTKPLNSNINTDMCSMWTVILQRALAGSVLLTKGLNTTWLLALEGLGGGPVHWRDNLATRDPDSSLRWGVIYPSVLASDNLPLIKGRSLSDRAEWSGEGETGGLPVWDTGILTARTNGLSRRCCTCTVLRAAHTHWSAGIYTGMCT